MEIWNRKNVTVKSFNFRGCMTGIRLTNSTNIVIAGNNFTYNNVAIVLNESHNSTIIGTT
ncbi:MAG: NosD domain-containing protein [Candidatus Bathyarchaeia archaeon]